MATSTRPRSRPAGLADPPDLVLGLEPIRTRAVAVRAARRRRMAHRRRRSAALFVLLLAAGMVVVDLARGPRDAVERTGGPARVAAPPAPSATGPSAAASPGAASPGSPGAGSPAPRLTVLAPGRPAVTAPGAGRRTPPPDRALRFPVTGPGTFAYAGGPGPVHGAAGSLRRFRIAVENGAGQDAAGFAAAVDRILADPRSWPASRRWRLQRVPADERAEFTIYLATPGTSEAMCATGGLRTERYTSCRLPGKVIINLARWWQAVPGYGAALATYQAYAVNHEVGHQLGFGHESCPAAGAPAPVMQQQTLGLDGCRANGWPYLDGRRHAGPAIP